jgi:deoxyribodipyrimidine photo-lyase
VRAQVLWFGRDPRVADHAPLVEAVRRGPIAALCVFRPRVYTTPDLAHRHSAQANLAFDR